MKLVKTVNCESPGELDNQINSFLQDHPVTLSDIKFCTVVSNQYFITYSALIIYTENKAQ